eukprot:423107_1
MSDTGSINKKHSDVEIIHLKRQSTNSHSSIVYFNKEHQKTNIKQRKPLSKTTNKSSDFNWTKWFEEYIFGEAEGSRKWCCDHGLFCVVISCFFRGVGQVVFMDNPLTGLIMFIGLIYFNFYYGLLGLIGGLTNYMTATMLLGTNYLSLPTANYLNNGIFVYNGLLIGLMCATFVYGLNTTDVENEFIMFLKLIPCTMTFSYICTSIHVGMTNMYPTFPVFTFPFNLAGFLWLPISIQITWIHSSLHPYLSMDNADINNPKPINNIYNTPTEDINWQDLIFGGIFRGPVQIYLCSNQYIGISFIVAMAICNWKASLLSLWGSVIGCLFAILIGIDLERISFGLHSYNSALTMAGIGCIFAKLNINNFIMAMFHSCICVFIELAMLTVMAPSDMPYLTLPFCLSTMFFSVFAFRKKQEILRKKRQMQNKKCGKLSRLQSIRGAPMMLDRESIDFITDTTTDDDTDWNLEDDERNLEMRGPPRNLDRCK